MGKVMLSGVCRNMTVPGPKILASELAVGSSVYINEVDAPVEYLIVNIGIPGNSSQYDQTCDGLWVLRKDIFQSQNWNTSTSARYGESSIHSYLNSTFMEQFDSKVKQIISQVRIPYFNSTGTLTTGVSGLLTQAFLLSGYEVGLTSSASSYLQEEGAQLSYFESGTGTTAVSKRIANSMEGTATGWWLRSPYKGSTDYAFFIQDTGALSFHILTAGHGVRPCLILPMNAYFDENTLVLKGVV